MATWHWERQADASQKVLDNLEAWAQKVPSLKRVQEAFYEKASVHLHDCIDHFVLPLEEKEGWAGVGYTKEEEEQTFEKWYHPGAQLPRVVFSADQKTWGVYLHVDEIEQFLMVFQSPREIEGDPQSAYRRACLEPGFFVVERFGSNSVVPQKLSGKERELFLSYKTRWKTRPRVSTLDQEEGVVKELISLAQESSKALGQDRTAALFLLSEREYWQSRNFAAGVQKMRQDQVGLGWANHDHHTLRSSRKHFNSLVNFMKAIGFYCRERFYAGEQAGWGAQVMEHKGCSAVLFLDVDLSPDEVAIDFASETLPPLGSLGTVGLWCALHGDSILRAGMHHLEAQFDFQKLRQDLEKLGIDSMSPFSDFSYLKQAFTKGEIWKIDPERLKEVYSKGYINKDAYERFGKDGAVGSHLENLERKEGYKGFNQKNVSHIIERLDLRKKDLL